MGWDRTMFTHSIRNVSRPHGAIAEHAPSPHGCTKPGRYPFRSLAQSLALSIIQRQAGTTHLFQTRITVRRLAGLGVLKRKTTTFGCGRQEVVRCRLQRGKALIGFAAGSWVHQSW
jgi:hypothetical protein